MLWSGPAVAVHSFLLVLLSVICLSCYSS